MLELIICAVKPGGGTMAKRTQRLNMAGIACQTY